MSVQVTRLGKTFFAEVRGVDLSRPLSDGEFSDIRRALLDHGVLAFPGQHLTDDRQVAFSACFGPLEDDSVGAARAGLSGRGGCVCPRGTFEIVGEPHR